MAHTHDHDHDYGDRCHSHGLIHESITRSHDGVRVVSLSLGVLLATAVAQVIIYAATGSVALLADVIHNFGDALTALPLGTAFLLRSRVAERRALRESPPDTAHEALQDVRPVRALRMRMGSVRPIWRIRE